jgi:hypothetical protein
VAVIQSIGLDFPTQNVVSIGTEWNGSGSASKIIRITGLGVPPMNTSRYYRWYFQLAAPLNVSLGTPHPIQDGFDASTTNWELETRATVGSMSWSPMLTFPGEAFPNNRWAALGALKRNITYRFELRITPMTPLNFTASIRVFNSSNFLVLSDSDFKHRTGVGSVTLASAPLIRFDDPAHLDGFTMGTNGAFQGSTASDHPVQFCYQGGAAISDRGWCGEYKQSEAP